MAGTPEAMVPIVSSELTRSLFLAIKTNNLHNVQRAHEAGADMWQYDPINIGAALTPFHQGLDPRDLHEWILQFLNTLNHYPYPDEPPPGLSRFDPLQSTTPLQFAVWMVLIKSILSNVVPSGKEKARESMKIVDYMLSEAHIDPNVLLIDDGLQTMLAWVSSDDLARHFGLQGFQRPDWGFGPTVSGNVGELLCLLLRKGLDGNAVYHCINKGPFRNFFSLTEGIRTDVPSAMHERRENELKRLAHARRFTETGVRLLDNMYQRTTPKEAAEGSEKKEAAEGLEKAKGAEDILSCLFDFLDPVEVRDFTSIGPVSEEELTARSKRWMVSAEKTGGVFNQSSFTLLVERWKTGEMSNGVSSVGVSLPSSSAPPSPVRSVIMFSTEGSSLNNKPSSLSSVRRPWSLKNGFSSLLRAFASCAGEPEASEPSAVEVEIEELLKGGDSKRAAESSALESLLPPPQGNMRPKKWRW